MWKHIRPTSFFDNVIDIGDTSFHVYEITRDSLSVTRYYGLASYRTYDNGWQVRLK